MNVIVKMPIKPHLRKFVQWKENIACNDPLVVSHRTAISTFLSCFITNKSIWLGQSPLLSEKYSDRLPLLVREHFANRYYLYFTDETIMRFNRFCSHMLHEDLNVYVSWEVSGGEKINQVIYDFMLLLGIEDDISFDALKRGNHRFREYKKLPIRKG